VLLSVLFVSSIGLVPCVLFVVLSSGVPWQQPVL
jgi:hypothetical protein